MDLITIITFLFPFIIASVSTVKITLAFLSERLSKDPHVVTLSLKDSRKKFYSWNKEGVSVLGRFSMMAIDINSEDLEKISYVSVLTKDDVGLGAPVSKDELINDDNNDSFLLVM